MPPIAKATYVSVVVLICCFTLSAQQPPTADQQTPPSEPPPTVEMGNRAYELMGGTQLPADFKDNPSNYGVGSGDWNVTAYFKKQEDKPPLEPHAEYDPKSKVLIINDTLKGLKLDDQLAAKAGFRPIAVAFELSALECSFPAGARPPAKGPLTYADVERLAKKSVTVLDRVSSTSNSGERVFANHIANPANFSDAGNQTKTEFAAGESGTLAETETNVTRDGISFDVNINVRFRKQLVDGEPKTLQDIHFFTSFPCLADHPVVLNVSSVPGREGTFVVITARVRFANANEKNID